MAVSARFVIRMVLRKGNVNVIGGPWIFELDGTWSAALSARPCRSARVERSLEELGDRFASVFVQMPRARAREVRVRDRRLFGGREFLPVAAGPFEPAVLVLIEDEQRLVAELRELRTPARAPADRLVVEDRADDVDLLAVVDLIPERLQHLADRRRVGIAPVHQLRHVLEAHVAVREL